MSLGTTVAGAFALVQNPKPLNTNNILGNSNGMNQNPTQSNLQIKPKPTATGTTASTTVVASQQQDDLSLQKEMRQNHDKFELLLQNGNLNQNTILPGCCFGSRDLAIWANCGSLNISKKTRSTNEKQHFRMENYESRL